MNHPKPEEWTPYLFGETTPDRARTLAEHLQRCPECSAEIAGWQRSLRRLDRWRLPAPRRHAAGRPGPALKWGIAAALMLGAGFGLGRFNGPTPGDIHAMRMQTEASLRASLASDIRAASAAAREQVFAEWQARFDRAMAGLAEASAVDARREFDGLLETFRNAREDDRRTFLAWFDKLEKQHTADYLSLRADLETVASSTDEEIRRANRSLVQLAADKSGQPGNP